MAKRKLSDDGKELVERIILSGQWTNQKLSEAATKTATRKMLHKLRKYINQKGLNYYKVEELVENGLLVQGSSTRICQKYSLFNLGKINLNWQQVEELVEKGIILVKGYSISTCQRFRAGENIETEHFNTLCEILEVNCESVVYRFNRLQEMVAENQKTENLKLALGEFDHANQWLLFKKQLKERKKLISLYIKNNSLQIPREKWLINCLIKYFRQELFREFEFSARTNNQPLLVKFSPIIFSESERKSPKARDKKIRSLVDSFYKQLATKLGINKNSTQPDIAKAAASYLNEKDSIILIFDKAGNLGHDILQPINDQFCQLLTNQVYPHLVASSHCLLLCYTGQEELKIPVSLEMNVDYSFKRRDLDVWINQHQFFDLFGIEEGEQINTKIEEIWNMLNCGDSVEPEALLQAIYQTCSCYEGYEEWTTWQTPTL